jgi:subtilase family serine protease
VVTTLPSARALTATVMLAPPNPTALAAYATAVSTPGSSVYRRYLTTAQFVSRFAPSSAAVAQVRGTLAGDGLDPGAVSANHLAITVHGTAGRFAKAFSTSFDEVRLTSGRVAYRNASAPELPASVAPAVQAVIGLDNLAVPHPVGALTTRSSAGAGTTARTTTAPHVVAGPQPCLAATHVSGAYAADKLASAYGLSTLFGAGDLGAGQTIGFFELSTAADSDIATYQTCYGTSTPVTNISVDGGQNIGNADEDEATLDIETAITAAPDAAELVYTGPATGPGIVDTYNTMVSDDQATVISTSYGDCEPQEAGDFGESAYATENAIFEEAATQGQSVVDASGDNGSEDCGPYDSDKTLLAVDDPAGQPYVTGVGGTTLTNPTTAPSETTWNVADEGASGGGVSSFFPMPAYQSGAAAGLHVINAGSTGTPCGATSGYCREAPDVSMDADPDTGYAVYDDGAWEGVGGTSAAAPLFGSILALANASSACAGKTVGFVNPALYSIAGTSSYSSVFNDITTGNNDWYASHTPAQYPAGVGYDEATGLGSVHAAPLATALCPVNPLPTLSGKPPKATVGAAYRYAFAVGGTPKPTVSVSTGKLPAGLKLSTAGVLTGTPTKAGTFKFTVLAKNSGGQKADAVTMTVSGSTDLSITLTNPLHARFTSTFSETATVINRGPSPAGFTVTETVPAGLTVTKAKGAHITHKGAKTTLVWRVSTLAAKSKTKSGKQVYSATLRVATRKHVTALVKARVASTRYKDPKSGNNLSEKRISLT